ncbi:Lysophospholipase L1 [Pedobacter sp. ok626]|uniref:SGNH/GDSL hydrolase family protein n=1 Tax=Pedobacter sp. ok626 TaxID=1761882 RepID=UPI00088919DA|nr:SGNH/GDSL hydrolase family protein [Pedobacter sp. ok626]SDK26370.1 Lysophospholipase L1 [Pedobacter sp. ok626]
MINLCILNTRSLLSFCLLLSFWMTAGAATFGAEVPSEKLEEFHQRGGLPNFFRKVKSGKAVTVAYFGGSITQATGGWRDLSFNWLTATYPKATFKQVNAAIGGTGSNLGVFRLEHDVLSESPDLIFVEFAVNDSGLPAEGIHRSMEGIVRKTWRKYPNADICFVYTIAENGVKDLQAGRFQPTAIAMEQIAAHYNIPSIHMGVEVIRLLDAGKLVFTGNPEENPDKIVFTKDKTHPLTASGHPIYAKVVARNFERMSSFAKGQSHALPKAYIKDNWEKAQTLPLSKVATKNDWEALSQTDELQKKFKNNMPVLYKARKAGASFTIKFSGTALGVYDLIGPKSGIVEVIIDGEPTTEVMRFDAWGNNYRMNAFFLKALPDGVHEVKFVVSAKEFDKAKILLTRNTTILNPDDYKENSWFVGNVLVVGNLLE